MKNIFKNMCICVLILIACLIMCIEDVRCDVNKNKDPTKETTITSEELQIPYAGKEQLPNDEDLKNAEPALKTLVKDDVITSAGENHIKESASHPNEP